MWKAFFQLLSVSVSLSSGYQSQTSGQTEHKDQEIGRYQQSYCHNHQHCWNCFLPWADYAQNSLRQTTTGLTPFQCILSYLPPLFPLSGEPLAVPAVNHWFQESERVWGSAHVHLQWAVQEDWRTRPMSDELIHPFTIRAKRSSSLPKTPTTLSDYPSNYPVWLLCHKLSPKFIGPIQYKISPNFHVSLLNQDSLLPSSTGPGFYRFTSSSCF